MTLTIEHVHGLAPDPGSLTAARSLTRPAHWRLLGRSDAALWGECQGSALYQVRVDLAGPVAACSCPSRKFPCKHGLALMLIAAGQPDRLPIAEPPAWVADWLEKRARTAEQHAANAEKKAARAGKPADPEAKAKRAEQRWDRVSAGLDALDLWMHDLVRQGLATVDAQHGAPWQAQAARLVDAQAPGLASRVRALGGIPRATARWADDLTFELGRIALLVHAARRLEDLDAPLKADIQRLIGWTMTEEDVIAHGNLVEDDWLVLGQWTTEYDDRIRTQRTWFFGVQSQRMALVLQFAAGTASFAESFVPATRFRAVLAFWPSAWPQRALLRERTGETTAWRDPLPGGGDIDYFLATAAEAIGRQPWIDRLACVLHDVVPVRVRDGEWSLVDRAGAALPLNGYEHWSLLALSGGYPLDVAAEWDGRALLPLLAMRDSESIALTRGAS